MGLHYYRVPGRRWWGCGGRVSHAWGQHSQPRVTGKLHSHSGTGKGADDIRQMKHFKILPRTRGSPRLVRRRWARPSLVTMCPGNSDLVTGRKIPR